MFDLSPTITYCEDNISGIISQPANSWSNLIYVFIGLYLFYLSRHKSKPWLKIFPVFPILIGLSSFAHHASYNFWFQLLDLGSMFLFIVFLLIISLNRLKPNLNYAKLIWIYISVNLVSIGLTYLIGRLYQFNLGIFIFGFILIGILILEYIIYRKNHYKLKKLILALIIFIIAFCFWLSDYTRIWCNPNYFHLINGHALWHIINSGCFVFIYRFYEKQDCLSSINLRLK